MAISLMLVALPILESFRANKSGQLKEYLAFSSAGLVKSKIIGLIQDDASWARTLANNALAANAPLKLYNADNTVAYDSTIPSTGLTLSGNVCDTFDKETGSDACPFRYDVLFVNNNEAKVRFFFRAQTYRLRSSINSYSVVTPNPITGVIDYVNGTFNRNIDLRDQKSACLSLGGTYDQATLTCSNVLLNEACGGGQMFLSSNPNIDCQTSVAQTQAPCGVEEVVVSIVDGSRTCGSRYNYANP